MRGGSFTLLIALIAAPAGCRGQQPSGTPPAAASSAAPASVPEANPGRPTVSTPAALTPVGYLQFESGSLSGWHSPGLQSQTSFNEVVRFAATRRLQLLASSEPFARSRGAGPPAQGAGDLDLGVQAIVSPGHGARPVIALSYFGRVYNGSAPDLDIGSFKQSALLLISADVKGFHYDTNYIFDEVVNGPVRRAQFGQTLSISHPLAGKFGIAGEIWHFSQPFLRGSAVGNLWAVNYNARPNLVFDTGFDHGLTRTSTRWEVFAGFTYLLPRKIHWGWKR